MPFRAALICVLSLCIRDLSAQDRCFTPRDGLSDARVSCFLRDSQGFLWVGTQNGLNRFDGYGFEVFNASSQPALAESFINALAETPKGEIWIATRKGLFVYLPERDSFRSVSGLPNEWVNEVALSPERQLWVACNNRDLALYDFQTASFSLFPWKAAVGRLQPQFATKDFKNIEKIAFTSDHKLRLLTNVGAYLFDPHIQAFALDTGKPRIANSYQDREGFEWTKSAAGFCLNNPFLPKFYRTSDVAAKKLSLTDADGTSWLAEKDKGLWRKKPGEPHFLQLSADKDNFLSHSVMDFWEDKQRHCLWIATEDYGLYRYDLATQKFKLYRPETGFPAYIAYQLCQDKAGTMWVATEGAGVVRYDEASDCFHGLGTQEGLAGNVVYGVAVDRSGYVWAATHTGLSRIQPQRNQIQNFTHQDGLPATLNVQLQLSPTNALLFAPPQYGLDETELSAVGLYFFPDSIRADTFGQKLRVHNFKVFDQKRLVPQDGTIRLAYSDNFFSLEMLALSMNRPEQIQFEYKLEGYDFQWIKSGSRRFVSYAKVPSGTYTFRFRTSNGQGPGLSWEAALTIEIIPPFWRTLPFYLLLAVVGLLLVGWAYRLYAGRIRLRYEKDKLAAEFGHKLAAAEMSALRAQMNPHFIFNVLTSINRFILTNETEKASDYLNQFSTLIRNILDHSNKNFISLQAETETLRHYIEIERLRFADSFQFRVEIDPSIDADFVELPPMLIQPYVENAIWHGLMQKQGKDKNLNVRFLRDKHDLVVEVVDDGIGRAAAALRKSPNRTRQSHGLRLTKERLKLIETLYGIRTQLAIQDLAQGTKVVLVFEDLLAQEA